MQVESGEGWGRTHSRPSQVADGLGVGTVSEDSCPPAANEDDTPSVFGVRQHGGTYRVNPNSDFPWEGDGGNVNECGKYKNVRLYGMLLVGPSPARSAIILATATRHHLDEREAPACKQWLTSFLRDGAGAKGTCSVFTRTRLTIALGRSKLTGSARPA